jgi:hypothetical protein
MLSSRFQMEEATLIFVIESRLGGRKELRARWHEPNKLYNSCSHDLVGASATK